MIWTVIGAVLQLILFILQNLFEKDKEVKKQNEELRKEAKDAILSCDASRVSRVFDKLRRK